MALVCFCQLILLMCAIKNNICFLKKPNVRFHSDEGPMLETLDYTIRIGSIPTFLYFDLFVELLCSKYFALFEGIWEIFAK